MSITACSSNAAREGCDVLLFAEFGNNGFSDKGAYGYVEYFLTGHWRQLWLALSRSPGKKRSMAWRFVAQCILPLLPTPLWRTGPTRRLSWRAIAAGADAAAFA